MNAQKYAAAYVTECCGSRGRQEGRPLPSNRFPFHAVLGKKYAK